LEITCRPTVRRDHLTLEYSALSVRFILNVHRH